jgi:hypothetical protein
MSAADTNLATDALDGIVIEHISGICPVQAEGTIDGLPFYFRARGQRWSIEIGKRPAMREPFTHSEAWGDEPFAAGWMDEDEARRLIAHGAAAYRKARHG